jgi:hypothetical protein
MSPPLPCKKIRIGAGMETWSTEVEKLTLRKNNLDYNDPNAYDYVDKHGQKLLPRKNKTTNNQWDPVKWYSQHGYNVTEMIKAPGKQFFFNSDITATISDSVHRI